jgi:flagella basal body P-ring formation protein FlgA
MAARTSLRADSVLYQRQLSAPQLVSRGDTVNLATTVGAVTVTTEAEALADGTYGERIEVRNPRSNRVITAWVTGAGRVSTRPGSRPR